MESFKDYMLKLRLKNCNKKTPTFSLKDETKLCKVVDIYDGDSCKVVFKLRKNIYKWNIRMNGYDSPEMRPSKSKPNRDEEIAAAKKSSRERPDFMLGILAGLSNDSGSFAEAVAHRRTQNIRASFCIFNFMTCF